MVCATADRKIIRYTAGNYPTPDLWVGGSCGLVLVGGVLLCIGSVGQWRQLVSAEGFAQGP